MRVLLSAIPDDYRTVMEQVADRWITDREIQNDDVSKIQDILNRWGLMILR